MKLRYLLEGSKIETSEELLSAIEKGRIQGVSPKAFFPKEFEKKAKAKFVEEKSPVKLFMNKLKRAGFGDNQNKALSILLKKARDYNNFVIKIKNDILSNNDYFDVLKAYFNNWKKQEFKTNEEVQKKTNDFLKHSIDYISDKNYEHFLNKKFAKETKLKDKNELGLLYGPDSEGWEVYSPKTFAAASKLACMDNSKTKWCTSSNPRHFKQYTKGGNKLYIIKNKAKKILYQMDWDVSRGVSYPNFMDADDRSLTIKTFLENKPSNGLLKFMKNPKTKETLKSIIDKFKKENVKTKEIIKKSGKWILEKLSAGEAQSQAGDVSGMSYRFVNNYLTDLIKPDKNKFKKNKFFYKLYSTGDAEIYYIIPGDINILKIKKNDPKDTAEIKTSIFKGGKKIPFAIKKVIFPNLSKEIIEKPKSFEASKKNTEFKIIRPLNLAAVNKEWKKFYNRIIGSGHKVKGKDVLIIVLNGIKYGLVKTKDDRRMVYTDRDAAVYNDNFVNRGSLAGKEYRTDLSFISSRKYPKKFLDTVNNFFNLKQSFKNIGKTLKENGLEVTVDNYGKIGDHRNPGLYVKTDKGKEGPAYIYNYRHFEKDKRPFQIHLKDGTKIKITQTTHPKIFKHFKDKAAFDFARRRKEYTKDKKEQEDEYNPNKIPKEEWRARVKRNLEIEKERRKAGLGRAVSYNREPIGKKLP